VAVFVPQPAAAAEPPTAEAPAAKRKAPPRLADLDTPGKRVRFLSNLYAELASADDEESARKVAQQIEQVWLTPASPTVGVLLERANKAVQDKDLDVALQFLDAAVELAPDYAEAWNRRAYVFYLQNDYGRAVGDLRRVIALDPSHFKALDGLAQIFKDTGNGAAALAVFRRLADVHPHWANIEQTLSELQREVEGSPL
jgi:tetratricopeptide (TPR) repeat protein